MDNNAKESFLYISWKELTIDEFLDWMSMDASKYPDRQMKEDKSFIEEVEQMGFRFIG